MNEENIKFHQEVNKVVDTSLWIFIAFMSIGLIITAVYLAWSISIVNKKGASGNGQNFGINYVRNYYPPLTSDK